MSHGTRRFDMTHFAKRLGVPAALATLAATGPAAAQGLDEAVNSVFASSTGWFVKIGRASCRERVCGSV